MPASADRAGRAFPCQEGPSPPRRGFSSPAAGGAGCKCRHRLPSPPVSLGLATPKESRKLLAICSREEQTTWRGCEASERSARREPHVPAAQGPGDARSRLTAEAEAGAKPARSSPPAFAMPARRKGACSATPRLGCATELAPGRRPRLQAPPPCARAPRAPAGGSAPRAGDPRAVPGEKARRDGRQQSKENGRQRFVSPVKPNKGPLPHSNLSAFPKVKGIHCWGCPMGSECSRIVIRDRRYQLRLS